MKSKTLIFHPLLFVVFPILSLYLANTDQMPFRDAAGALLLALGCVLLVWLGLYLGLRDVQKSAIPVSLAALLFFSFAHIFLAVKIIGTQLGGAQSGWYEFTRQITEPLAAQIAWLVVELLLVAGGAVWVWRRPVRLATANQFLNFFSCVLVFITIITWALPIFGKRPAEQPEMGRNSQQITLLAPVEQALSIPQAPPDIYYIILDGYGRSDVLQDMYEIDSQAWLDFLESKGFYVAAQAHSNYTRTALSMASSLNFMQLDTLEEQIGRQSQSAVFLLDMMEENRAFRSLQAAGYQILIFSNGITFNSAHMADRVFSAPVNLKSFESVLINNTPLSIFLMHRQYDWHRQRILYTLEHLPDAAQIAGPKLVIAHILIPHPPFVFGAQGEPHDPPRKFSIDDSNDFLAFGTQEEYLQGYRDQVQFISASMQKVIEGILAVSPTPPVIIIQGDHGPGLFTDYRDIQHTNLIERFSILNAYYFPGASSSQLYPGITPVNTFRVLFNTYFGTHYPLLEDHNYIAPTDDYYNLIDVTEQLAAPPPAAP